MGISADKGMSCPIGAVAFGETAYFRKYRSRDIFSFNCHTRCWKTLPECLVEDTTLVILPIKGSRKEIVFILHTVGGIKKEENRKDKKDVYTDALYQLQPDQNKWVASTYPDLPTKRSQLTAIRSNKILVTVGGRSTDGATATVEVLHFDSENWYTVTDLPRKQYKASGCICNEKLYILGGYGMGKKGPKPIRSAFEVELSRLEQACSASSASRDIFFNEIESLPLDNSTCVSALGFILAIGGSKCCREDWISSNEIHAYHPSNDTWQHLPDSSLPEKRCFCFSVVVDQGDKLEVMVVGGYKVKPDVGCTKSVEIAEISKSQQLKVLAI